MTHIPPSPSVASGTTDGVPWTLATIDDDRGMDCTRWHTTATRLPRGFLLLVKVAAGQARWGGDLALAVAVPLYRQILEVAGVSPANLQGWDEAQPLDPLDARLVDTFVTRTSAAEAAHAWLTPPTASVLADVIRRSPTPNLRPLDEHAPMLYILVAPGGLWAITYPKLASPDRIAWLAQLGADLARAGERSPALPLPPAQGIHRVAGTNATLREVACPSCAGPAMRAEVDGYLTCRYCGSRFAPTDLPAPAPAVPSPAPPAFSRHAVGSAVAGVAAWTIFPFASIIALILGVQALRTIRGSRGALHGGWAAVLGIVLGVAQLLLVALFILLFIVVWAFPSPG